MPFTDKQVQALRPKQHRYEKREGRSGLAIRVSPRGPKIWTYVYRHHGKQKRMELGRYPEVGVAQARVALAEARAKLSSDLDPGATAAARTPAGGSIEELAEEYLRHHARKNKKASSATEDERMLVREVLPAWKGRPTREITRRDIIRFLDEIEERAPIHRNRVAALLSMMFTVGLDRGLIDAHPAVRIRRLPERSRDRVLTLEEIQRFWMGLEDSAVISQVRLALRLALITGQRRSEVAGIVRTEIDDATAIWRLPSQRTKTGHKTGRDNLVPLPAIGLAVLNEGDAVRLARATDGGAASDYLFPSPYGDKPIEPPALTRAFNRNRAWLGLATDPRPRLHDLRRTFATYHGELGTPPEVLGALLNHTPATITGQVYNRAQNIEARRAAMERWGRWLELAIAGRFDSARAMFGAEVFFMRRAG